MSGDLPGKAPPEAAPAKYGVFAGFIDQSAVYRVSHWLSAVTHDGGGHVHLLFQSSGGNVADGVFLYNFLRTFPFQLTLYNGGSVQSIAAVAFLAARHRKVSKHGTFMVHRTHFPGANPATARELLVRVEALKIDDQRTETILREHLRLEPSRWNDLDGNDVWFTADEAVRVGIADGIADFAPPPATPLWDFNLPIQGMTP
jgi:ATP-dependent Clp protease protease subunit